MQIWRWCAEFSNELDRNIHSTGWDFYVNMNVLELILHNEDPEID